MVDILLASYNGGKYIEEQIKSVLKQTFKDWRLIIRDDGSNDNTTEIIEKYVKLYPKSIVYVKDEEKRLGCCKNFFRLLEYVSADYIMFCDQDDFWFDNKIEKTLKKMRETEKSYGLSPILVHTDLKVADNRLKVICDSFFKYQGLDKNIFSINRLLCQNSVTGCTVMINKELLKLVMKGKNGDMLVHDWWIALIAAVFGHIVFLNETTIYYRQHNFNQIGARKKRFSRIFDAKDRMFKTYRQALSFYDCFKDFENENIKLVKKYGDLFYKRKAVRIYTIFKYGYTKYGFMLKIGEIFFC